MAGLGPLHPQIIHFVIGCLFVGFPLYLASFLPRPRFLRPAAATLLLIGALSTIPAVMSGGAAHGVAERIPGNRSIVQEHEAYGERTRAIFLVVLALEAVALGMAWRAGRGRTARVAQAAVAVLWGVGIFQLYETAEHGGKIVYEYAGGVGFRAGDPDADVPRLLRAGLFNQAELDRDAGRPEDAARLIAEMVRRFPDDAEVRVLGATSALEDAGDAEGALRLLAGLDVAGEREALQMRKGVLEAQANLELGRPGTAAQALARIPERFRDSFAVADLQDRILEAQENMARPAHTHQTSPQGGA